MYQKEWKLKHSIYENICHAISRDSVMFYTSAWVHQPYIQERAELLLQSMLNETGHVSWMYGLHVYGAIIGNSAPGNLQKTAASENITAMHVKWPTLDPSLRKCVLRKDRHWYSKSWAEEKTYSKSCIVNSQGLKIVQVVSIELQVNFFDHNFFGCLSVIVAKMDVFTC